MKIETKIMLVMLLFALPYQIILLSIYQHTNKKLDIQGGAITESLSKKAKIKPKKEKVVEEKKEEMAEEQKQQIVEQPKQEQQLVQEPIVQQPDPQPQVPTQSNGGYRLTHYGHDCCGTGITASGYDVRNTIYYNDTQYGQVRIVAMCSQIPMYSIVKINNYKFGGDIIAIVIDRGVGCSTIDLLAENETTASQLGIQNNVVVDVLRSGA